jgi:hypothetical protein
MRHYSPTQGRWIQIDPVGFAAGDVNFYRAESDTPTNLTDPVGLDPNPDPAQKPSGNQGQPSKPPSPKAVPPNNQLTSPKQSPPAALPPMTQAQVQAFIFVRRMMMMMAPAPGIGLIGLQPVDWAAYMSGQLFMGEMRHIQFWIDQKNAEIKRYLEQIKETQDLLKRMREDDAGKPKGKGQYEIRIPLEEMRLRHLQSYLKSAQEQLKAWMQSQQYWIMRQRILTSPNGRP